MSCKFDAQICRKGTSSVKFDTAIQNGYPEDILPMWIADMDFQAPPCVLKALHEAIDHGIFGYSMVDDGYFEAVHSWFSRRFDWDVERAWMVHTPGVVAALATAVRCATQEGDSVLIQPPVYYPFYNVIRTNGRKIVESPLRYENGKYTIDFADFEQKIRENDVKMFILCSPHNPICRVWTKEELEKIGRICHKYGVTVVSDEIHCDFAHPGHDHTPFIKACPELADRTIVCTAPSKSFNLAGLQVSNIFIPGESLRAAFRTQLDQMAFHEPNQLGLVACKTAYANAEQWLTGCKEYILENLAYVRSFLAEKLPEVKLVEPEGTYFAWMDCSGLGLSKEQLDDMLIHKAKLWLDSGSIFGDCAAQFQRMVLACPRATVIEAMQRLYRAVKG